MAQAKDRYAMRGHIKRLIPAAIYFVEGELEQEGILQKVQRRARQIATEKHRKRSKR